jgi:hypothetical protein
MTGSGVEPPWRHHFDENINNLRNVARHFTGNFSCPQIDRYPEETERLNYEEVN